jgi:hypothetical protein
MRDWLSRHGHLGRAMRVAFLFRLACLEGVSPMSRRKKRNRAPRALPVFSVFDEQSLGTLTYWARRLAYDNAEAIVSRSGEPSVALRVGAFAVAGVVCANERLRRNAELICEAILIRREDSADDKGQAA